MHTYYAQMNTPCSAAAARSGWFCAAIMILADIALAVSVVFCPVSSLAVRLCPVLAVPVAVQVEVLLAGILCKARKR